jgi:uncharacterized protein YbjQ (UPF0145 family)
MRFCNWEGCSLAAITTQRSISQALRRCNALASNVGDSAVVAIRSNTGSTRERWG